VNALARWLKSVPRGLWLPIAIVVIAQIAGSLSPGESMSLAPPLEIASAGYKLLADGTLLVATGQTLLAAAFGLAVGGIAGLLIGVFLGRFRTIDRLLDFSIEVVRPIPPIALLPIGLMVFGFGYQFEAAIIAFGVLWPILVLTRNAIAGIEPQLLEFSALLEMSSKDRTTKIILPAILPRLFVAFRLAAGIALILAVTVEITINPLGLGRGIMLAGQSLEPAAMLAFLVWIGFIGTALNASLLALQKRWFSHGPALRATL
jgi:ABC-type nitrate/sulfonate/bicarbonate transport system permease component